MIRFDRAARLLPLLLPAVMPLSAIADTYVTPATAYRWGVAAGIRFNDVGGIRFNDVGGFLTADTTGIRFNDVGGIRFNDVGGIRFNDVGGGCAIDLELIDRIAFLPDTSVLNVIITYHAMPTARDLDDLRGLGVTGGSIFRSLPMVVVTATRDQIAAAAQLPSVRSIWSDRALAWVTNESLPFIGVEQAAADPSLRSVLGLPLSGAGVTIAFVDTGIDGTHPDLPFGSKVLQNVRLEGAAGTPGAFIEPLFTEGIANTDLVLGHGTFGAGIAAGTGEASGGVYRGVAIGAGLVGVSVGDLFIVNVLEGFDWILTHRAPYGIRVVNCSFATSGPFDLDDPINIATRLLHDAGITVVVAAGNYGPAPDTLSPYAVAPWVIGVASGDKSGRLSVYSSRGIFNEGLYHPTITAPGERIVSTSSLSVQGVFGVSGAPSGSGAAVPVAHRWAYSEASGTSFAAPHVAGVIALMLEADPTMDPDGIKRVLQRTATPMLARDRAEVGAGYLDAWAALSATMDPVRPFGAVIPETLDERPFAYDFGTPVTISGTVPVGGAALVPLPVATEPLVIRAGIAWGPFPSPADLDLAVVDAAGVERARAWSVNALGLFGLSEGVTLYRPGDDALFLSVTAKTPLLEGQDFTGQVEIIAPVMTPYADLADLAPEDRAAATLALVSRAITGDKGCFCGDKSLKRDEAARLIALAAQLPQTVPAVPSFTDVGPADAAYPYVESVANPAARRGQVMAPQKPFRFGTNGTISRIDLAVAAVNALGLQDESAARGAESLGVADASDLPPGTSGHAAVALDLGILSTTSDASGDLLRPLDLITRLESAHAAVALLARVR